MGKRDFLKIGIAGITLLVTGRPVLAAHAGRVAIVEWDLPGAAAFAAQHRSLGALLLDTDRMDASVVRPLLAGRPIISAYIRPASRAKLVAMLRGFAYAPAGQPIEHGRGILWSAAPFRRPISA